MTGAEPTRVDPIFGDPLLAAVYDAFDGARGDLDAYVALVDELGARSVLDVGCGTGTLALRLAQLGLDVTGADPATASLDVARAKPGADRVRWIAAGAAELADVRPAVLADLAVLTGNVAQVFVDDAEWRRALSSLAAVLRPGGHLVLETRKPQRRAWQEWATRTATTLDVPGVGPVRERFELRTVQPPLVSFRWSYLLPGAAAEVSSDSTLVFREREQIETDLADAGFDVVEVREAPDRPGLELVFVCRRQAASAA